jgi:hypothetical protein
MGAAGPAPAAAVGHAAPGAAATGPGAVQVVTTGPARSLGEPTAAGDAAVSAVAATSFGAAGAVAQVWTRRASAARWMVAGSVLPAGFGSSYDASAAASPGGPLLVVAGTAPPGESCITNGSVALATVGSAGRLGPARLVSDQRGTGSFDDRPAVAIGPDGTVWVAWSQGPDSDACQDVGSGDRIEVAASHDGGRTFGRPVDMPADGGQSAFGVRLAPLPSGRLAVSWTETMRGGDQAVLVSVLGPARQLTGPSVVLTGDGMPLVLPGASFYDFPAGDIAALPGNTLVVAAPFWRSGHGVIKLAIGTAGGQWQASVVSPPAGADLLLPALGVLSADEVRLLCAVHTRSGDRLGYDWADVRVTGTGAGTLSAGLAPLTPAPAGPGFFEIGEELSIARTPAGLLSSVVVAGRAGAALETATLGTPLPAATSSATPRATATSARPGPAKSPGPAPATASGRAPGSAGARQPGAAALAAWLAGGLSCCAVVLAGWLAWRRRSRRAGAS